MTEVKLSLEDEQVAFLHECKKFGFKDEETMVRTALKNLKKEIENHDLKKSADLYAELYEGNHELHEITEEAISGWPE